MLIHRKKVSGKLATSDNVSRDLPGVHCVSVKISEVFHSFARYCLKRKLDWIYQQKKLSFNVTTLTCACF